MATKFFCGLHLKIDDKQTNVNKITRTFFQSQAENYNFLLSKEEMKLNNHKLFENIVIAGSLWGNSIVYDS